MQGQNVYVDRRQPQGLPRILFFPLGDLWRRRPRGPNFAMNRIVWFEIVAFAAIIAISWASEYGLETAFFGEHYTRDWRDPILQTVITLSVAIPTIVLTARLSRRLHYLERFLRVCAWCRRIGHGENWVSLEEFLRVKLDARASHGICPECSAKLKYGMRRKDDMPVE